MGIIFSKSDADLVKLCNAWSTKRDVDPLTGNQFQLDENGHNSEQNKYEIACMNILNGSLATTKEEKQKILLNLSGICTDLSDPITLENFEDGALDNIVFLDSSVEGKKHCFILESIADHIYHQRKDDPHATLTNPYTRGNLSDYDVRRIETMIKLKILKLLKSDPKGATALLSRFQSVLQDTEFMDVLIGENVQLSIVPFLDGHREIDGVTSIAFNNRSLEILTPDIDKFVSLITLNLSGNLLTSLPDSIGNLSLLKDLNVSHNMLTDLPFSIENLQSLTTIDVSHNQLTEFQIHVQTIENINISYNKISHLNVKTPLLKNFNGSYNELSYLPSDFWELKNVDTLDLSNNYFTYFAYRFRVNRLFLAHNNLTSISDTVYSGIKELNLGFNSIADFQFDKFTQLEVCILEHNKIRQISDNFGGNGTLRKFLINNNYLEKLPDDMVNLRGLTILDVRNNMIRKIPLTIYKLALLEYFDASHNRLKKIPSSIMHLTNLEHLDLSNNRIATIPEFGIQNLEYLSLENNPLRLESPPNYMRVQSGTTIEDNIFVNIDSDE